jgi:hypothetical protein
MEAMGGKFGMVTVLKPPPPKLWAFAAKVVPRTALKARAMAIETRTMLRNPILSKMPFDACSF